MKRVLIVSPHFPPTNAPDHQRVRMSLPYFQANGWEAVVLAVEAGAIDAPQDPLLNETLPTGVKVERVSAWPIGWTRRVGLGNIGYRAWASLRNAGDRILGRQKFDLVYFSTTQFVVTALGRRWKEKYAVPFVIDIQDPWRTDYYERPGAPRPPGGWKYHFARWQAARLEERSWRDAAGFISVTEDYLTQLRARYAWFENKPADVIPFGASEVDFALARSRADVPAGFIRGPELVHLVSVGAAGPIMRASLSALFAGLQKLRVREPSLVNRLRFHFIGTSYASSAHAEPSVAPVAAAFEVSDLVQEQTARIPYFSALKTLLAADAIVIPGSDDIAYNPSKLATCFLAGKPVLALSPAGSLFERMAAQFQFATASFGNDSQFESTLAAFCRALPTGASSGAAASRDSRAFEQFYSAQASTVRQCALFDRALAEGSSR